MSEGSCNNSEDASTEEWIAYGGFLILIFAILVSFWGLGVVVEEYFVPALNLLCDDLKLADDVAGATIMAIGNSSPELFSCLLSLYVTKSTLGVGTAIGSAVFNHLCICAGSILYAEGGVLDLDWRILSRECIFYLTSILILVWTLKGDDFGAGFADAFKETSGVVSCLKVTWYQAFVLFLGYCLYVIICSNYAFVVRLVCPLSKQDIPIYEALELDEKEPSDHGGEEVVILANNATARINVMEDEDMHSDIETASVDALPTEFIELPKNRIASFYGAVLPTVNSAVSESPRTRAESLLSSEGRGRGASVRSAESTGDRNSTENDENDPPVIAAIRRASSTMVDAVRRASGIDVTRTDPVAGNTELSRRESASKFVAYVPTSAVVISPPTHATSAGVELTETRHANVLTGINEDETVDVTKHATFANYVQLTYFDKESDSAIIKAPRKISSSAAFIRSLPEKKHDLSDVQYLSFECWLYKGRRNYSAFRQMTNQTWQLRYFVFDANGFRYCPKKIVPGKTAPSDIKPFLNMYDVTDVAISSVAAREIVVSIDRARFRFRCLNEDDFYLVFETLKEHVRRLSLLTADQKRDLSNDAAQRIESIAHGHTSGHNGEDHLMTAPSSDKPVKLFLHYLLYPVKFLLYYTIPEISPSEEREENSKKYWNTIGMSVLWLAILCYIMNDCLEIMGTFIGISPDAMGLTFGAAGTSIPNLLSSMIVARQGLGNMAISNAFGSNIFCIYFVLGFSWTLFVGTTGAPYDGLKDSGIVLLVIIVLAILVMFLVMVFFTKFVLRTWMAYFFLLVYVGFLAFAFTL